MVGHWITGTVPGFRDVKHGGFRDGTPQVQLSRLARASGRSHSSLGSAVAFGSQKHEARGVCFEAWISFSRNGSAHA